MGIWFLATALSETLATRISKWAAIDASSRNDVTAMLTTYTELFEFLTWLGVGFGIFILIISPILRRGMAGVR
jgi:POT family proton-dependent oligopeptide transporter